jgi:TonB family protein
MKALESWIAVYVLNSIWQVPLVFAAAWIAARLARSTGPRLEHRVWIGALLGEAILPAFHVNPASLWRQALALIAWSWGSGSGTGEARVIVGPSVISGSGLRLPAALLTAIVVAYACILLYFTGRLAWGVWRTDRMLRGAQPFAVTGSLAGKFERNFFEPDTVQVAISPNISGPVTIGVLQRVLLLPPGFLERVGDEDLDAVLAHEFAHMQRRDFAKNLLYGFISLPAAYHPALWLTTARLSETREMVCDETAAEAVTGRESYARALLRLASMLSDPAPTRTLHAIGIFDANIFERRVMNLTQRRMETSRARRTAIMGACAVIALATCASAVALRMEVAAQAAQTDHPAKIHVKADDMKIVTKVPPVYPDNAKAARIQGSVILDAIIDKEGVPEHLSIEKGPAELQQSALDAVRQWRWQPYLLNGDPIEVQTTVTVEYKLWK